MEKVVKFNDIKNLVIHDTGDNSDFKLILDNMSLDCEGLQGYDISRRAGGTSTISLYYRVEIDVDVKKIDINHHIIKKLRQCQSLRKKLG